MHAAPLEAASDDIFAGAFDDAGCDTEVHGTELWILHPLAVIVDGVDRLARFLAGSGMSTKGGEDVRNAALIEFVTPVMRSAGGDREVPSRPNARSRGLKPRLQWSQ